MQSNYILRWGMKKSKIYKTTFNIYEEIEKIGEGGAGSVYRVRDEDGGEWALKTLDPSKTSKEKLKRFKNELYFCSRNEHPNIITVIDRGIYNENERDIPFLIMPLYNHSLRQLIKQGIIFEKTLYYFAQIIDGVEAAHLKGIYHRDIKPENILYDSKIDKLVVADFGIAHFSENEIATAVETRAQTRLANFQYAAPEQRIPGQTVDNRADIYALGLLLNEMFTGSIPQGTDYKLIEHVSPDYAYLDGIVARMIRQSSEDRYGALREIKQELIARENEFISLQKVSKLKGTVMPEHEIDDRLINNPMSLIGVDWINNRLLLKLNQPVNPKWVEALHNMGSYTSVMGKGPAAFIFSGDVAEVMTRAEGAQRIIDYFKDWLLKANARYKQQMEIQHRENELKERKLIQDKIHSEEIRQKLLRDLKV